MFLACRSPLPRELPGSGGASSLWLQRQRAVEGLDSPSGVRATEAEGEPRLLP